jgi:hypothetical protein
VVRIASKYEPEEDGAVESPLLQFFSVAGMPPDLQQVLWPFACLARHIDSALEESDEKRLALSELMNSRNMVLLGAILQSR